MSVHHAVEIAWPGTTLRTKIEKKPATLADLLEIVYREAESREIKVKDDCPEKGVKFDKDTIILQNENLKEIKKAELEKPWSSDETRLYYVAHNNPDIMQYLSYPGFMENISPVVGIIKSMIASMDLEKLFTELFDNSIEAKATSIRVTIDRKERKIIIEDNGPGSLRHCQVESHTLRCAPWACSDMHSS
jgi:hypothetical protein